LNIETFASFFAASACHKMLGIQTKLLVVTDYKIRYKKTFTNRHTFEI